MTHIFNQGGDIGRDLQIYRFTDVLFVTYSMQDPFNFKYSSYRSMGQASDDTRASGYVEVVNIIDFTSFQMFRFSMKSMRI